jgi:hypothetical protein
MAMLRNNFRTCLSLAVLLIAGVSTAQAQVGINGIDSLNSAGVAEGRMMEQAINTVNDPAAVDVLFKEGNPITSVLDGLKEKGFHIEYQEKQFLPTMTLVTIPTSERIDEVLREILEPYDFRVYHSPAGQWIVKPNKKDSKDAKSRVKCSVDCSRLPEPVTPEH